MGIACAAEFFEVKVAVYTCITKAYDIINPPAVITDGVEYLCFNDGSISVPSPWQNIRIDRNYMGKDANRYIKILPHLNSHLTKYDLTIYVDGVVDLVGDLSSLISHVHKLSGGVFLYEHPHRRCVYLEARACIEGMKAPIQATSQLMKEFRSSGLPNNFGLFECTVVIRKKSSEVNRIMDDWWEAYKSGVKRDQIAIIYVLWRTGAVIQTLGPPDHRVGHRYFRSRSGHKGDIARRYFTWWIWRRLIGIMIGLKLIKL